MSHPIVSLKTVENVGHIVELLKCVTFNGFPVVDPPSSDQVILEMLFQAFNCLHLLWLYYLFRLR